MRKLKRTEWPLIHVRYFPVLHAKQVYLQRIDGFQGLLPPALSNRGLFPCLRPGLSEVDMQLRSLKQEVGDQPAMQECSPVNAGVKTGQTHYRRIRMLVLNDGRDRKSTRLNSSHQLISYAVFCLKKKK